MGDVLYPDSNTCYISGDVIYMKDKPWFILEGFIGKMNGRHTLFLRLPGDTAIAVYTLI